MANFNSGSKLDLTVRSILSQGDDLELVVIDGASSDQSVAVARDFETAHPQVVRLYSEKDDGIYHAMNKGVRVARGRYIYFIGAGDAMCPEVLTRIRSAIPQHDSALVYGHARMGSMVCAGRFNRLRLCDDNICHQAIFYGREIFRINGDFNLAYKLWADYEFNLRCYGFRCIEKVYVPLMVADFELGGASGAGDKAFSRDRYKLIRQHLGLCTYLRYRIRRLNRRLANSFGRS